MDDRRLIPLSALQHYAFCPRQCALIHNERLWLENSLTSEGQLLHQRVDNGEPETRKGIRYERSVHVCAEKLGLTGQLDLIEIEIITNQYRPIEYKRGCSKSDNWDEIQLCAQALCLEEMLNIHIEEGALWYWKTRSREAVFINPVLRQQTLEIIGQVRKLFNDLVTPKAKYEAKCDSCSLYDICNPKLINRDKSKAYVESLFIEDDKP